MPATERVRSLREALFSRWVPLALQLARDAHRRAGCGDLDDYCGVAVSSLWDTATKYDPARFRRYPTFAIEYVRSALRRHGAIEAAGGVHVPRRVPLDSVPRPVARPVEEVAIDRAAVVSPHHDSEQLWATISRIVADPRLLDVLELRHRHGSTWAAIGTHLGISESRARQLGARAVERLREQQDLLADFNP